MRVLGWILILNVFPYTKLIIDSNCVLLLMMSFLPAVSFDSLQQQGILWAKDSNISSLLSVLPLARSQFDLSVQEFRNSLALQYKKSLLSASCICDDCGEQFSNEYALNCCFGSLVSHKHNEV